MTGLKEKNKVLTRKEEKRLRNYFFLGFIFLVSIGLTLYFCKWYEVYEEYEKEVPVIRGSLLEITREDLEHYVIDNPSFVVYMCTSEKETCRTFEKDLKKYVNKEEITDEIIYLNLTGVEKEEFIEDFNNRYSPKPKLKGDYPTFVSFTDGEVDAVLQTSKNKKVTISKLRTFMDLYESKEEDYEEFSDISGIYDISDMKEEPLA